MARYCTICQHQERQQIDWLLLRHAASYRSIAARYGLRPTSVQRHQATHLHASLAVSKELGIVLSSRNLLDKLSELDDLTRSMLLEAHNAGDIRTALIAVGESRHNIESYSRIGIASELERRIAVLEQEQR